MARTQLEDMLQNHRFWLLDILPTGAYPFFVLGSPLYGFSAITSPEIELQTREIKQVNSMWNGHVYEGGSAGEITLSRGARGNDSTFYDWVKRAIDGFDKPNRTLLLIHYTRVAIDTPILPSPIDSFQSALRLPGRAWVLWDCLPTRYKSGSDFDATSADVSIMELSIHPHFIQEIVLLPSKLGVAALAAVSGGGVGAVGKIITG